jgi:hypothetical protein
MSRPRACAMALRSGDRSDAGGARAVHGRLAAAVLWLTWGRFERALVGVAVAAIAASFGARSALFSRR